MAMEDDAARQEMQRRLLLPILLHIFQAHPELLQQVAQLHQNKSLDIRPQVKPSPGVSQAAGGAYNAPQIPTNVEQFLKFRFPPSGTLEGQPKTIPQLEGLY